MTQRRVENTRVHFGANSPVSVKFKVQSYEILIDLNHINLYFKIKTYIFFETLYQMRSWTAATLDLVGAN